MALAKTEFNTCESQLTETGLEYIYDKVDISTKTGSLCMNNNDLAKEPNPSLDNLNPQRGSSARIHKINEIGDSPRLFSGMSARATRATRAPHVNHMGGDARMRNHEGLSYYGQYVSLHLRRINGGMVPGR